MIRISNGVNKKKRHNRVLKKSKGFYGRKSKTYKKAKETLQRAMCFSYRDRKVRKRKFRELWITNINIFCRKNNTNYSKFIKLLKEKNILINRKNLFFLINNNVDFFKKIIN